MKNFSVKQLAVKPVLKNLGMWMIPLVSVTSVPFALAYWFSEKPTQPQAETTVAPAEVTKSEVSPVNVPSLSQLPNPTTAATKPIPPAPTVGEIKKASPQKTAIASKSLVPDPLPLPKSETSSPQKNATKNQKSTRSSKAAAQPKKSSNVAKSNSKTTTVAKSTPKSPQAQVRRSQQAAIAPHPNYAPPPLEIRVGIARKVPSVTIGTSQQAFIQERSGGTLKTVSANQPIRVTPNGNALNIGNMTVSGVAWLTPASGSYLFVGDRWYRGRLLLVPQGNTVTAVNYVDLEHYLTSVVGSEMHSTAPMEALKAQAIAARSYALVHIIRPASQWFDLGDNQRWQVYKGINSEYQSGFQAVAATMGQVLSYKGGVVESLYASTDDIVAAAHKGRGMSQIGAYGLARKGYDYQQILNRYYPGVSLARMILQQ
ncbi:MAG: SpoIID/LytB domain-containing protein [Snowella sp.]|nr:SpoIID/LytB domain-containing protein [Snowella sp.]